jgi:tetratricopeptide (TPR) repeat protein
VSNKNKIINQAQKFIQKGQWDKAIKELQKLVAEDPNDVRTLLKLGDVFAKKGERDQATKVYRQVAESYSEQGFFLKAVAVYKQILKHDPQHLEVTLKLAELYEHLGLTSEAMAQYQIASQLHEESGKARDSLDVLKRMVELDQDNVASRIKLAESYSRENMVEEAIQEFSRAADVLKRQNRTDDYIKVAERLAYHDPNRIDVIKELAQLYLKKSDTKRGLAKLQLCFKAQPKDVETLTLLASAFRDLGQVQKTIFVYRELARIHQENARDGDARAVLNKILEIDPGDPEARAILGMGPTTGGMAQMQPGYAQVPGQPAFGTGSAPFPQNAFNTGGFAQQQSPVAQAFGAGTGPGNFGPRTPGYGQQPPFGAGTPSGAYMQIGPQNAFGQGNGPYENPGFGTATDSGFPIPMGPDRLGSMGGTALPDRDPRSGAMRAQPSPSPGRPSVVAETVPAALVTAPPGSSVVDSITGEFHSKSDEALYFEGGPAVLGEEDEPAAYGGPLGSAPPPSVVTMPPKTDNPNIAKILTETDVYIKYGLREKALDHLRRIFEIDPDNALAFTKMRDLYLSVGDTARAAESIANLIHIHARRGDVDSMNAARVELQSLAPGHPLIASSPAPGAAGWPGMRASDIDSIDITENSDVFGMDEVAEVPVVSSEVDPLDAWFQGDPAEGAGSDQPLDAPEPSTIDPFGVGDGDGAEMSEPPEPAMHPSFDTSFSESSGLSVGEGDIVASELDQERFAEDEHFEHETTEAGDTPERSQYATRRAFDDGRSDAQEPMAYDAGGNGAESMSPFDQPEYEPPEFDTEDPEPQPSSFESATARGPRLASPSADLDLGINLPSISLPTAAAAADEELPEASVSQVVSLDEVLAAEPTTSTTGEIISADLRADVEALAKRTPTPALAPAPAAAAPDPDEEIDEQQIEDDLDEAEFLAQQGLVEEAQEMLASVLERVPNNARALQIQAEFNARGEAGEQDFASDGESTANAEARPAASEEDEEAEVGPISGDEVASAFDNLSDGTDDESPEDHYDQGIAYKELNRLDDAIAHFKVAVSSPTRGVDSLEMLGHCHLQKQDFESAIGSYWQALELIEQSGGGGSAATNLKYEIAATYEAAGDAVQAIAWFQQCYADDPEHRDVADRLTALGAASDEQPEAPASQPPSNGSYPPQHEPPPSGAPSPKKNKISYI